MLNRPRDPVDHLVLVEAAHDVAKPRHMAGRPVDLLEQGHVRVDLAWQPEQLHGPLRLAALSGLHVRRRCAAVQLAAAVLVWGAPPGRLIADSAALRVRTATFHAHLLPGGVPCS
jgi:hypothetical protein